MKILVAIANYGTQNDQYLDRVLNEYRSMPFDVHLVVVSNLPKNFGADVEVRVGLPTKDPWSLPFAHKPVFADAQHHYDLFIYSEDDHLITTENIEAFLELSSVVRHNELPGFIASESDENGNLNYCGVHTNFHWDPLSVRSAGRYTFARFTNEHSACYLLTKSQLRKAIDSGGFLVPPHEGKYDLACSASTDPYTQCGYQKVICISHLPQFTVKHLTNKYLRTIGIPDANMDRQIGALQEIAAGSRPAWQFMRTETRLPKLRFSKSYYEPIEPDVLKEIPGDAKAVLSVGCGSGLMESALLERGARTVGIPLDSVIAASAQAAGVEIVYRDLERAFDGLPGGPFDCLLLSNVLHLLGAPEKLLTRSHKALSANARIIATVPNLSRLPVLWGRLRRDPRYKLLGGYTDSGVQVTSRSTVQRWFRSAGFRVEKIIDVYSPELPKSQQRLAGLLDGGQFASDFTIVAQRESLP